MKWDVIILSTNGYSLDEITNTELIPEKYFYNDQGDILITGNTLDSEETIYQLISFLFNSFFESREPIPEIYRDNNNYVLDLSSFRERLIDFDYLEEYYPKWIEETERENTMDEYGMLLDFIGFARRGMNLKYLFMIVSKRLE